MPSCTLGSSTPIIEPWHEISNNVVCATSKDSDQPAHTGSLIRASACCLNILCLKKGCTGSSESTLVKMPHCWKYYVAAHLLCVRAAMARLCLHLSKCHIVENIMLRLTYCVWEQLWLVCVYTCQNATLLKICCGSLIVCESSYGSSVSTLVKMPHCWKYVAAHLLCVRAAMARLCLHLSKCHIVENIMLRLTYCVWEQLWLVGVYTCQNATLLIICCGSLIVCESSYGSSVSTLVKMPHCWKYYVAAHLLCVRAAIAVVRLNRHTGSSELSLVASLNRTKISLAGSNII